MLKIFKRSKIKRAIEHHTQMRRSILYARGQSIEWYTDHTDELLQRAECEKRCINRLINLLEKYK